MAMIFCKYSYQFLVVSEKVLRVYIGWRKMEQNWKISVFYN